MRAVILAVVGGVILGSTAYAKGKPDTPPGQEKCNWGQLTSSQIQEGFPQGPHASDPSGDGHGPGTADEPRAGLPNILGQGDLQATCEFIAGEVD